MGADGSGWANVANLTARHRIWCDAAVLAVDPGNHLHGIRPGRPRVYCSTSRRAARDRRQIFPGEVVLARACPDGQRTWIMSLQQGGNSHLFVMVCVRKVDDAPHDTPRSTPRPSYAAPMAPPACASKSDLRGGKPRLRDAGTEDQRNAFPSASQKARAYSTPVWSPRATTSPSTNRAGVGSFRSAS